MVKRRNAFSPASLAESEEGLSGDQRLHKLAEDLTLVGISWNQEQPLAMIEDKQEQKTYFLRQGESIGEFQIKQILKNKVILNFEGQDLELM
jgi:type II secretory pathway component PulC